MSEVRVPDDFIVDSELLALTPPTRENEGKCFEEGTRSLNLTDPQDEVPYQHSLE
jgi:hypothetical protein